MPKPRLSTHTSKHRQLRPWLVLLAGLIICGLVATIVSLVTPTHSETSQRNLQLGSTTYHLETVRTLAAQEQGLSGRSHLAPQTGMLFAYDQTAQRCMWMKDMKFNIDIIWLDSTNAITKIEPNLTPATYPQVYCADAQNVLELPAGTAGQYDLKLGQALKL